jgi:hypothetical protein
MTAHLSNARAVMVRAATAQNAQHPSTEEAS